MTPSDASDHAVHVRLRAASAWAGVISAAVGAMVLLGWIFDISTLKFGLYGRELGGALFATSVVVFAAVVYWNARSVDRSEREGRQAWVCSGWS